MRAFFSGRGQSQLAGYAGTAGGILRGRIHPLVPIAAIDLLAIVVGIGALTLAGTIVSGQHWKMFVSADDRTMDDLSSLAASAPSVALDPVHSKASAKIRSGRVARQPADPLVVWAAMPDLEVLFGPPVLIGGPFESSKGETMRFVCTGRPPHCGMWPAAAEESPPTDNVAANDGPASLDPKVADDGPQSRLVAARTQTRVLPGQDHEGGATVTTAAPVAQTLGAPPVAAAALQSVAAPVAKTAATVTSVAAPVVQAAAPVVHAAAPVVQATASVAQAPAPVTQAATAVTQATAPVAQAAAPVVQAAAAPTQQVQSVTQSVTGGVTGLLN